MLAVQCLPRDEFYCMQALGSLPIASVILCDLSYVIISEKKTVLRGNFCEEGPFY